MSKMTLHGIWLSGPTYKAGLALSVMGQPFAKLPASSANPNPDVWLPKDIEAYFSMMVALGQFDFRATINYADYKLAETSSRIK